MKMDDVFRQIAGDMREMLNGIYQSERHSPQSRLGEIRNSIPEIAQTDEERWALEDACKNVAHILGLKRKPNKAVYDRTLESVFKLYRVTDLRNIAGKSKPAQSG